MEPTDRERFLLELCGVLAAERADMLEALRALQNRLGREVVYLKDALKHERDLRALTGESAAITSVRRAINQVARTDSTVLIHGETGTGKELVARAIHQVSRRRDRLLVAVNCAALGQSVLTSELFGHEKGAFTGATQRRIGRFELAEGGTLFLDEVGEIAPETQVMLLRVLQERTIERVGGNQPIGVDVRVIAGSHRDLEAEVRAGRFRADLYYRLNVFPIHVPPLRDRKADIPGLVRHFIFSFNRRMQKHVAEIDEPSLRLLTAYNWPGNVRELENIIERAIIMCEGRTLSVDPQWLRGPHAEPAESKPLVLKDVERKSIEDALARSGGRIYGARGAAAALGLKPTTLYGKMRRLGIERPNHSTDGKNNSRALD